MNGKIKSVCTICGNIEYHPSALHNKCGTGECEGRQYLPEVEDNVDFPELDTRQYWEDRADNDPDDGSWVGR